MLGHLLRRFNILKDQAFAAISALVMNVTLPCVILTNLNGVRIEGDMLLIAGLGLLTNIIFLVWGLFLSRNIADTQWRDFVRLNVGGYSVGPFAVPYVQSFFPTTGLMATCMFDVGNCVMAGGGTFAVIAGTRVKTTLWRTVKLVVSKLVRSGPLVTFAFVGLMSVLDMRLPDGVITSTAVGGLVVITPASGFVGPVAALVMGLIGGVCCFWGAVFLKRMAGWDDSLDAFGVHGVGGIVGALLTGVFASSAVTGSEMNPVMTQVGIQAASVVATMVYASAVSWILLKIIDVVMGLRVTSDEERMGLDLSLHGERIE